MKIPFILLILGVFLLNPNTGYSQKNFKFPPSVKRDKISFELVNNLVIIPVEVNGTELSFLLDTGVSSTLLFSLDDTDSLQLNNAKPLKIKGLGEGGAIDALVSGNNIVKIGDAVDDKHTIYVVLDKKLNFSTRMGVAIHGIIGYDLFKDFIIKTDYGAKRLTLYEREFYEKPRCRKCKEFDLVFDNNKPYINVNIRSLGVDRELKLLLDSGSSDALWLFDEEKYLREDPKNYFSDFLGLGLSGDIFGKRSKTNRLSLGEFVLDDVTCAFPDEKALANIIFFEGRDGSLGSEILKRFTVIMDYSTNKMLLRRNSYFNDPFFYNMSGLTLEHDGLIPVKELGAVDRGAMSIDSRRGSFERATDIIFSANFNFFLAPKFVVAEVVEGSPAALAGIKKGDEIISVNGKLAYKYKLYELVDLFSSKPGKRISIILSRNGYRSRTKFVLKKVI